MSEVSAREFCQQTFLQSELYKNSNVILTYIPIKSEPDTLMVINDAINCKKDVFAPCVSGNTMNFYKINNINTLSKGAFSILEPKQEIVFSGDSGICIIPGLAFDKNGGRLGYGKGYYDRFLSSHKNLITVAFCPGCNFVDSLPVEKNDIPIDYIIVDDILIKAKGGL